MRTLCLSCVLGLLTVLSNGSVARADVMEEVIDLYMDQLGAYGYNMTPVNESYVTNTFSGIEFCGVYFDQWPHQVQPPEGMALSNVFYMNVANKDLNYLTGPDELEQFFQENWPIIGSGGNTDTLEQAAETWLRLSQEFSQDGFYQFSEPLVEVIDQTAFGFVAVTHGGHGFVWAALTTGPVGSLSIEEERHIYPGPRPIGPSPE